MKYGLMCAISQEIKLLSENIVLENKQTIASREFIEGKLYGKEVVLVLAGVGKVSAALTTSLLIDHFKVDKVIFCGVAGGIDPALNVGDVVVSDKCVQHDIVVGNTLFTVPRLNVDYFPSDSEMTNQLYKSVSSYFENGTDVPKKHLDEFNISSPKAVIGTVATGDQFICDGSKNKWLYENVDNIKCTEMEGAATAQVCYEYNIPYCVIRVISDSASSSASVDYDMFIEETASHFTHGIVKAYLSL